MLQSLTIENFKALERLEMTGLKRINLIGGANNIGKTTVLEAIALLIGWPIQSMFDNLILWRKPNDKSTSLEQYWKTIQYSNAGDKSIMLASFIKTENQDGINERVEISIRPSEQQYYVGKNPVPFRVDSVNVLKIINMRDGIEFEGVVAPDPRENINKLILFPKVGVIPILLLPLSYSCHLFRLEEQHVNNFSKMVGDNREEEVVLFLKEFEPRIKSITTLAMGGQPELFVDMGLARKIPVSQLGDGMVRMLSIFLNIAQVCQNGILLIDEVENGIHHSIMTDYWRAIAAAAIQYNCQIFATTHSYECIQAAYQGIAAEHPDDLSFIRLDRKRSGELYAQSFDVETLATVVEQNWEVR